MLMNSSATERVLYALEVAVICICANSYFLITCDSVYIIPFIVAFATAALSPIYMREGIPNKRLHVCCYGVRMLILFTQSTTVSIVIQIVLAHRLLPNEFKPFLLSAILCAAVEAIVFLIGIICVYTTSVQLGIKLRLLGAIFGLIPFVNIILLFRIVYVVGNECVFEMDKARLNERRHSEQICATKYPVLFVHGVFFRDYKHFNYWGRIPAELEQNGAVIYYGDHHSAASVADCGAELDRRIRDIVAETGCDKVNVIAHSKGGLDMRYAMHHFSTSQYVASLTTINSPHRGSLFADHMIGKIPRTVQVRIANAYNKIMKKLGDTHPDLLAAVFDLMSEKCIPRDRAMPPPDGVYCASVGSKLNHAKSGKFPLNITYPIAKQYDDINDGLVGEPSFRFGEDYTLVTVEGKRGVGHGDMVDLNRENFEGFDVREFYVQLVYNLKKRGL